MCSVDYRHIKDNKDHNKENNKRTLTTKNFNNNKRDKEHIDATIIKKNLEFTIKLLEQMCL